VTDKLKVVASPYEAWRSALVEFYRADGPWFQKIANLEHGDAFTREDLRVIDCLMAAVERMPVAA
jgi:hypothetical protein